VTELKHLYLTKCLIYFLKFVVKYLYLMPLSHYGFHEIIYCDGSI